MKAFEKRAIVAPSTTRWSADQLTCTQRLEASDTIGKEKEAEKRKAEKKSSKG